MISVNYLEIRNNKIALFVCRVSSLVYYSMCRVKLLCSVSSQVLVNCVFRLSNMHARIYQRDNVETRSQVKTKTPL